VGVKHVKHYILLVDSSAGMPGHKYSNTVALIPDIISAWEL